MSRDLQRRLGRLETQDGDGPAVVPVVVYRPGEDHDAAIGRVFGGLPPPPTIVFVPDNGRGPAIAAPTPDTRLQTE